MQWRAWWQLHTAAKFWNLSRGAISVVLWFQAETLTRDFLAVRIKCLCLSIFSFFFLFLLWLLLLLVLFLVLIWSLVWLLRYSYMYVYIYIYATGFVCGPPKRVSRVHLRPPMRSFAAPPFETTVFVARNRFFAVFGNQFSSLFSDFSGFSKMPFWRSSRSFFCGPEKFCFLRVFLVWGLRGTVQEVVGRETLENKGFRSNFALWCLVHLRWTRCIASMLHESCENNFWGSHKFVFSEVRIFNQIGFGRQKNGLGLQNWGRFENDVFPIFPGREPICEIFGAFSARSCVAVWVRFGPLPEICLRLRCGWFFRVFRGSSFNTVFANLKRDFLQIPSLLFVFCFFLRFLLDLGSTQPCTCVLGQLALSLSFLFVFCLSVYKNTVSPWKKIIFVHFSVSPFLSPWLQSLLLFTLCLSLSLFLSFSVVFLSFLVFLFHFVTLLVFLLFFCLVSLLLFHDNNNIKILDVKGFFINFFFFGGGFLFCCLFNPFFLIFVFHYLSSVFWVNMNVSVFLKRPFQNHRFLFCILWNIIVFIGAHFVGKAWMMCKNTIKIGISAHCW